MSESVEELAEESVAAEEDDNELDEGDHDDEGGTTGNVGEDEGSERLREDDMDEDESTVDDDDEDELTVKSDDASSATPGAVKDIATPKQKRGKQLPSSGPLSSNRKRGRSPSVKGLTIPFRTVKKAMKVDPDTPIVQNEAAVMTTIAAELFLKSLANASFRNAKRRGRSTIRYEDIAEARTNNPALSFLETLLP